MAFPVSNSTDAGGGADTRPAGFVGCDRAMTDKSETLPLGVVLERRKLDNPWQDHSWRPVGVLPGAGPLDPSGAWLLLDSRPEGDLFHAGTLALELFRKETEGYKVNLSQEPPQVFVILRPNEDPAIDHEMMPFKVTACPYEAQDYLDSSEEIVEPVAMPLELAAFVQAYIDKHHVDEPFLKRKRKPHDPRKAGFGQGGTGQR